MTENPLDLASALRAVWRRKLVVLLLIALGAAFGVVMVMRTKPVQDARALVLLPSTDIAGPGNASPYTSTQIIIAASRPVVAAAAVAVSPPLPESTLSSELSVSAMSQNVLQIDVKNRSGTYATRLANAVADSYVNYVLRSTSTTQTLIKQLKAQSTKLTTNFVATQAQINRVSGRLVGEAPQSLASRRDSTLLAALQSGQQQILGQLNNISSEIVNAEVAGSQSSGATKVLEQAALLPTSHLSEIEYPLAGALVGMVAGCALVMARARRDKRLRTRDALAATIGVPVLASLSVKQPKTANDWQRFLEKHVTDPAEAWNARRVFRRVLSTDVSTKGMSTLNLFVTAGDRSAYAAAVALAKGGSQLGLRVVIEAAPHPSAAALCAGLLALSRRRGGSEAALTIEPTEGPTEFRGMTVRAVIATVPATEALPPPSPASVLVVAAGALSSDKLASTALAATSGGNVLEGIVVANPDPDDGTTGSLTISGDVRPLSQRAGLRHSTISAMGGDAR